MPDGTPVDEIALTNGAGLEVRALTYGCIVRTLRVPDRTGQVTDVVHGFDTLDPYLRRHPYFGAVVGRYANRIANARFTLNGRTRALAANNGPHHLHGGRDGFDRRVWQAAAVEEGVGVVFSRTSADGEEGYPGTVDVQVTYRLNDANELSIVYRATTDAPTPVNLSQHTYFNLAGHDAGDILDHELTIDADRMTPTDEGQIPLGTLTPVEGTPFDFRSSGRIGARIDHEHEQLRHGRGYDHNFVLNGGGGGLRLVATLRDPSSGRTLDVLTTEPGMQLYSGNLLDGSVEGKGGVRYARRSGLCLETQHFPDSPNQPHFPSTILRPGETYHSETVFKFGG
jgi:aldose 1-epimerase